MSQQINLFNPVFLKKRKQFSVLAMIEGLGVVCLALALLAGYTHWRARQDMKEAARVAASLKAAQSELIKAVDKTRQVPRDKALEDEVRKLEARMQSSQQVLNYARSGGLSKSEHYTDYFRSFSRQAIPGVWLTGFSFSDGGADIEISGRALHASMVPAYIKALGREPLFRGKSFASIDLQFRDQNAAAKGDSPGAPSRAASGASGAQNIESMLRGLGLPAGAAPAAPAPSPTATKDGKPKIQSYFDFKLSSSEAEPKKADGNRADTMLERGK
ncbi:PilN domain-containing protein [Lacisediminimonas profundi]|uniref:PilN domain-containing protein n=1 Tax=Lacisediminimonas profundi TaxID=2603856 RepID=UPI00124AE468|nr:PilN domain-containing protein [Lacisediminimonas profundi]